MDSSRDEDLTALHKRMNNPDLNHLSRFIAWRSFNKILEQVRDRTLTELRHRLVRARQANDLDVAEKIELQIKEHSIKKGYERGR